MNTKTIGLIGSGSWATALLKILQERSTPVCWHVRRPETLKHIEKHGKNPRYLSSLQLDTSLLSLRSNIEEVVHDSQVLLLAIPAVYVRETMQAIQTPLRDYKVISAVKGIIPGLNLPPSRFLQEKLGVSPSSLAVITGPSHAEEIALERLTYLTVASAHKAWREEVAGLLETSYVKTLVSKDVEGIEYAGISKNVYAIGAGIASGLGYGDNFMAVFLSNALLEMSQFLEAIKPNGRDVGASAYAGDLLVTSYSQFSRNRTFGTMIGKGYPVRHALLEMHMVAEGYYAAEGIHKIIQELNIHLPLAEGIHQILYNEKSPAHVFNTLIHQMK